MRIRLPKRLEAAIFSAMGYNIEDEEEEIDNEDEMEQPENIIGVKITKKTLIDVEDDWVNSYIIN